MRFAGPSLKIASANWVPLGEGRSKAWIQIRREERARLGPHGRAAARHRRRATVTVEVEDLPTTTLAPQLSGADGGPYFLSDITLQARMAQAKDGSFIGLRGVVSTADGSSR